MHIAIKTLARSAAALAILAGGALSAAAEVKVDRDVTRSTTRSTTHSVSTSFSYTNHRQTAPSHHRPSARQQAERHKDRDGDRWDRDADRWPGRNLGWDRDRWPGRHYGWDRDRTPWRYTPPRGPHYPQYGSRYGYGFGYIFTYRSQPMPMAWHAAPPNRGWW